MTHKVTIIAQLNSMMTGVFWLVLEKFKDPHLKSTASEKILIWMEKGRRYVSRFCFTDLFNGPGLEVPSGGSRELHH